jgi:hypothetical protein
MRRIVKSLAAAGVLLALGACSGGSVLNFTNDTNPDRVIITVQGPTNLARVLPGAGLPLSAIQVKGSQNTIINGNNFRWSAALTTGLFYNFTTDGNQQKPCGTVTLTQSGTGTPYLADFGVYIAIDPTNEANVIFIPPTIIPVPAGAPAGSTVTPVFPYCVTINAQPGKISGSGLGTTFTPNGSPGSITIVVVNPAAPLG